MKKKNHFFIGWVISIVILTSCRDIETVIPPKIEMEKTEFTVKSNRNLLIEPTVGNMKENTVYSWKLNGKVIGTEKNLTFKEKETGTYFLTFRVVTEDGAD